MARRLATLAAILVAGPALAFEAPPAAGDLIRGTAVAKDGDGLVIGHHDDVRLAGADAFELGQPCKDERGDWYDCGIAARIALDALVDGREVLCTVTAVDRYDRPVAFCTVDAGDRSLDLAATMVEIGLALDSRYAPDYSRQQAAAEAAGHGAHRGTFSPPWTWRALRR